MKQGRRSNRFAPTAALESAVVVVLLSAGLWVDTAGAARIKCWTNSEGNTECGNVIPPEYAQQAHRELNRQGITVSKVKRAKTKEEVEREERAAREAQIRATVEDRRRREQASKDRVLLDTFSTEDDLIHAHGRRVEAIETRVKYTRAIVEDLRADLAKLRKRAANEERSAKAVSKPLRKRIAGVEREIQERLDSIEARNGEKQALKRKFEAELARYRELKQQQGH